MYLLKHKLELRGDNNENNLFNYLLFISSKYIRLFYLIFW